MGQFAALGGMIGGSISSGLGTASSAASSQAASKLRQQEETEALSRRMDEVRREGDAFLAEQRNLVGRSGFEMSGTPLGILASNAAAVERDVATLRLGIRKVEALELFRRKSIRKARDLAGGMLFFIPGQSGSAAAFGQSFQESDTRRLLNKQTSVQRQIGSRERKLGKSAGLLGGG